MNRRMFLAAAPMLAHAATPIRIAFLGTSHSHAEGKMQVVRENPDFALVTGLTKAQILADKSIPVVAVEGDVAENASVAKEALRAGKHVHLEKPPAATLADFREIQDLAARGKLIVQLGYMWRYNPAINRAMEIAKRGDLGDVYLVRATMNTWATPDMRKEWARFPGGDFFEQGSHLVDIAVRMMGKPDKVTAVLRQDGKGEDSLKDNTVAILEWPRAMAILTAATLQPNAGPHRSFEILGTKGAATVRPLEPPRLSVDLAGKVSAEEFSYRRYVDDFRELAGCVRSGKPLSVTPQQDLWATETLLRACGM
jgi:predicted dehydrogenase